jgi:hypothetical protein
MKILQKEYDSVIGANVKNNRLLHVQMCKIKRIIISE